MKRSRALLAVLAFLSLLASAAAQTIPELFQKAKAEVKAGSWQEALKTLGELDAEASKPGNEAAKAQLEGPGAFYRAVCEANLGQADMAKADFARFLAVQPNASIDPAVYSKSAVAAFEAAQKDLAPAGGDPRKGPSVFAAFQEFKMPPNAGEVANEQWGDGPARWLMSADEKSRWPQLTSGGERIEFVEKFWVVRNPRPGTPDNTAKTGFERRVAFADAYFVQDEKVRGSLTDRGMVFVLLGPPTYVGRRPIMTGEDPATAEGMSTSGSQDASIVRRTSATGGKVSSGARAVAMDSTGGPGSRAADNQQNWREVWHYRKELLPKSARYGQVDVDFITRFGYGVNVLQREPTILNTLDAARKLPETADP
jgi:GWxTD domain-containing protein